MTVLQFKRPGYRPDPRNGEVYATESHLCRYEDGREIEVFDGFAVVHMSRSGDSASIIRGFDTLDEAERAARQHAEHWNAEYLS